MANPVLIGKSNMLNHNGVSINVEEMKVQVPNARPVLVPYVYKIILESTLAHKPLWILDGQHRIHGLGNSPYVVDDDGTPISPNGSIVENETIPVVFVIDSIYQPKFLAKIFTEVTTEAVSYTHLTLPTIYSV